MFEDRALLQHHVKEQRRGGQAFNGTGDVARLLIEKPNFSRAFAEKKLFYIKRPEQLALYLDGLRKAGVPEN